MSSLKPKAKTLENMVFKLGKSEQHEDMHDFLLNCIQVNFTDAKDVAIAIASITN